MPTVLDQKQPLSNRSGKEKLSRVLKYPFSTHLPPSKPSQPTTDSELLESVRAAEVGHLDPHDGEVGDVEVDEDRGEDVVRKAEAQPRRPKL